ncbi:GmrSD restriction endonuclease domain-containing protein [Marinitoga litoralis]|jgi:hypothetical protein|uniref:GmrSD restriction endonuclease domain-containing protein n=1 Tax=Marinitoga litoralis TaxID=570855 RepID=UPI00196090D9|nr:DUF262 domain-containing protein [Marinitoga litoralis]MBM7559725.1 hypothetical protein [Marinitoga litoralis]
MNKSTVVFNQKTYQLHNLVIDIDSGIIALPDIQRPFVWDSSKVRDLVDSLYKGLPVGNLILWEVSDIDNFHSIGIDKKRSPKYLVIDGQQRLTSLYSILMNKPVKNKNFKDIKIKIAFNPLEEKFEVTNAALEKDPEWIGDISELFSTSSYDFIEEYKNRLKKKREDIVNKEFSLIASKIQRLENIKNYTFSVLELSSELDPEEVAEIFVRINSKGKTLNQSDFILTLMSVYWDEGRKEIEEFCKKAHYFSNENTSFNLINLKPSPEHLVRSIVGYSFFRGRLKYAYLILKGRDFENRIFSEELKNKNLEIFKNGHKKVLDLVNWHDYIKIIYDAGFVNDNMISSKIAFFITYVLYLIGKERINFRNLERIIRKWLVFSLLTQRYTGSPESIIEKDLLSIKNNDFLETLDSIMKNELTESFWKITLPNEKLVTSNTSNILPIYDAALIYEDKFIPFSKSKIRERKSVLVNEKKKTIERHHIFPKNYLHKLGIKDVKDVNQIANLMFLDYKNNIDISDKPPSEYWNLLTKELSDDEINKIYIDYDLPKDFWDMDYFKFLKERRYLMAKRIRNYFESL